MDGDGVEVEVKVVKLALNMHIMGGECDGWV